MIGSQFIGVRLVLVPMPRAAAPIDVAARRAASKSIFGLVNQVIFSITERGMIQAEGT